jgi:hypothetical protein
MSLPQDVWGLGHSVAGTFLGRLIGGTLCSGTFCSWDVSGLGRFVVGRFVGVPKICEQVTACPEITLFSFPSYGHTAEY